jgi:hypothetical protein
MENLKSNTRGEAADTLTCLRNAINAFQNVPTEHAISAMAVVVWYVGIQRRFEHFKRGEEHFFRITHRLADGSRGEDMEGRVLNAYAVRDEFLKVKEWSGALEFLGSTGIFSPLGDTLTWSEFQRWQRFVYLVQEHNELATAMQSGWRAGEHSEILKALTGNYPSSFFDFPPMPESELEARWRAEPEMGPMIQEAESHLERKRRELWAWFREPPGAACSIEWVPHRVEDKQAIWHKLQAGGAMIEFLLPQSTLQPVLLIRPSNTLEAIAAVIYGDRIHGVEYRACEVCKNLFKLRAHKDKKYCDRESCKNTAHQRRRRAVAKARKIGSTEIRKTRKGRQK